MKNGLLMVCTEGREDSVAHAPPYACCKADKCVVCPLMAWAGAACQSQPRAHERYNLDLMTANIAMGDSGL